MQQVKNREKIFDLIVVGGGASGFFGAIQAAEMKPGLQILLLEKSTKLLAKVRISGGGRCNVTHNCFDPIQLAYHYPRGEKQLKSMFKTFQARQVVEWFESKGVELKAEEDGRMFPVTDDSQTIIDCFLYEAQNHKIRIELGAGVTEVRRDDDLYSVSTQQGRMFFGKKILIATGGNPGMDSYRWIEALGHRIIPPIPSLFTFNDREKAFADLMGIAVPDAEVRIEGTKFSQRGAVLITHWGLSGPAVIKLSAWSAEYLHGQHYSFRALVSWVGSVKEDALRATLSDHKQQRGRQKVFTNPLFSIPQRLWERLCDLAGIEEQKIWTELPNKNFNRLIEFLIRCPFDIKGKTTFKEEFVTCGGVDLKEINPETMESRNMKNVFFAGEVLHIDGETGGFNFQAAWTTAFLAAKGITSGS
jgi:hypothetical protein